MKKNLLLILLGTWHCIILHIYLLLESDSFSGGFVGGLVGTIVGTMIQFAVYTLVYFLVKRYYLDGKQATGT